MTKLDYEPKRPRRPWFSSHGFTFLLSALLLFVFVAGNWALFLPQRNSTSNLLWSAVLIFLGIIFGYLGIKRWLRDLQ